VLGAFALVAFQELAQRGVAARGSILGGLLIGVVLACPGGIAEGLEALATRLRRTWRGPG
jgi:hypothetical protein